MPIKKLFSNDFKKRYTSIIPLVAIFGIYLFIGAIATEWMNRSGIRATNIIFIIFNYGLLFAVGYEIIKLVKGLEWGCPILAAIAIVITVLYFLPLNGDQQKYYFYNQINWSGLKSWVIALVYIAVGMMFLALPLFTSKISYANSLVCLTMLIFMTLAIKSFNEFMLNSQQFGWSIFVWIILTVICTDTFAFLGGISLGKHKLAPVISPKKSIEGLIIGCLIATLVGCAFPILLLHYHSSSTQVILRNLVINNNSKYIVYCCLALCMSFVAVGGDLLFSFIKRLYGIKDFSNLIPGHGGILDRLDSISLVFVFVFILVTIFGV